MGAKGQIIRLRDGLIDTQSEPFKGLASGKGQAEVRLLVLRQEQAIGHVQLEIAMTFRCLATV